MSVCRQYVGQNHISGTKQSMMRMMLFLKPRFRMLRNGQELWSLHLLRVGSGHGYCDRKHHHQWHQGHQGSKPIKPPISSWKFGLFMGVQSVFLSMFGIHQRLKAMGPRTLNISTVSGPLGSQPGPLPIGPGNEAKGAPALIFPEGSEGETGQQNEKHVDLIQNSSRAPSSQNN